MSRQDRGPGRIGRVTSKRYGVQIRRAANQSIANNTLTAVSWDTEDSDPQGFIAVTSSTLTIPNGGAGLYAAQLWFAPSSASAFDIVQIATTAKTYDTQGAPSGNQSASFGPFPMSAGNTLIVNLRQQSGGSLNITAQLNL